MTTELGELTEAALADVCSLVTDGTHDTPRRVKLGYPLIKAKEIVGGRIDFETCDQISEAEHLKVVARSKPEFGDTLFAHIGASLGEAAFVNTTREFSIKNIALFKPNHAIVDPRYLHYLVISPAFQAHAKGTKTGSAQPFLGLSQLRSHRIQYHRDMAIQRRIAVILSAYDELIENNQRRIKILEEIARSLYREWFVHFRFPGHEKVKMVPSPLGAIPQGWEVKKLGDIADLRWGDTTKTKASYVEEGFDAYSASGLDGMMDHYDFDRKGVVLSAIGANCGRTWFASGKWSCIKNTIRFWSTSERISTEFLFIATLREDFWPRRGAAQPFISQGDAEEARVVCSDQATMNTFTAFADAALQQISSLVKLNANLRFTRDLLLPRLLSGAIELPDTDTLATQEIA
jgi:type I restriction enzyme S subunit